MNVAFYPQINISLRFRYSSEINGKTLSFLHNKESEFRLDNLENHQNWQLNLFAINYNNEEKHEGLKLHYSKTNIYNINIDNTIIITTNQIKFDFIEIEKIKKSKLIEGKQRENVRILAIIQNNETGENLKVISKIIRNKGPRLRDDLNILSIGRPPSATNWGNLIITFVNDLLYYPEEMTLLINDTIITCSTKKNDNSLQHHSYEFIIPEEILQEKEELKCVVRCLPFEKCEKFSHKFFDIEKRRRKSCKSISQNTPALNYLTNNTQCESEYFPMEVSHQVHNIIDKSDNSCNNYKDGDHLTIQMESNTESFETQDSCCLDLPLIKEDRERIRRFSDSRENYLLIQQSLKNDPRLQSTLENMVTNSNIISFCSSKHRLSEGTKISNHT